MKCTRQTRDFFVNRVFSGYRAAFRFANAANRRMGAARWGEKREKRVAKYLSILYYTDMLNALIPCGALEGAYLEGTYFKVDPKRTLKRRERK